MGGILVQSGAVLISFVMLGSGVFSKTTDYVGILMHGFDLAHIMCGSWRSLARYIPCGSLW
jgi:hypothetical protein